ncbi:hypothetical protein [Agromyces sp. Marseille-Q5079]|uniref:hypothetical protein n=1 Tax=Agromyces sp. Marseille-Q5079 TaxID=3439059 RepID=UPI003D9C937D
MRRTYLGLGIGELAAALVFTIIASVLVAPRLESASDVAALWSALLPLLVILIQAGTYWLAARRWVHLRPMPSAWATAYRVFRITDVAVLAIGLVGVFVWWPDGLGTTLLVLAVWLFGVIEYVNYFVVRLSYPVGRWFTEVWQWRTPRLVQDLRHAARER